MAARVIAVVEHPAPPRPNTGRRRKGKGQESFL
jgi:hypothetical protein